MTLQEVLDHTYLVLRLKKNYNYNKGLVSAQKNLDNRYIKVKLKQPGEEPDFTEQCNYYRNLGLLDNTDLKEDTDKKD